MVMATLPFQWRHHRVVTLGQVLFSQGNHPGKAEKDSKCQKEMRAMSNILHGDVEKNRRAITAMTLQNMGNQARCTKSALRFALQRCGALSWGVLQD